MSNAEKMVLEYNEDVQVLRKQKTGKKARHVSGYNDIQILEARSEKSRMRGERRRRNRWN